MFSFIFSSRVKKPALKCLRVFSSLNLPEIDIGYYCNKENIGEIKHNINVRKGVGDIDRTLNAYNILKTVSEADSSYQKIKEDFYKNLISLPNRTHPAVINLTEPCVVNEINNIKNFGTHSPLEFSTITRLMNLMRIDKLGHTCGHKSYYFLGELAELEETLIKYSLTELLKRNFQLVLVPDILPSTVLESCGMNVNTDRTQIYSLDPTLHGPGLCLSGTAEMALAGMLMNTTHNIEELPLKLASVSRCFRAETSNVTEERGIYRVHQFTKVEMFIVTTPDQSETMLEDLRSIQEELYTPLGFNMKVLDMPPHELGAPAYRKYDIEAWFPGRKAYGEISSCSNCTDYQSRRLNIKFSSEGHEYYVHTLNGTACAIPRILIALLETHQDPKGKILLPESLQPYMNGKKYISKNVLIPELKLNKIKR